MSNSRFFNIRKLLSSLAIVLGTLFLAGVVCILIAQADFSEKQSAAQVVSALDAIIPKRERALPEPHYGNDMPSAEIGGENFVGVLQIEQYGRVLPVASEWSEKTIDRFPAAYTGNIYNRDLVIGAGNKEGNSYAG